MSEVPPIFYLTVDQEAIRFKKIPFDFVLTLAINHINVFR